MINSEEVKQKFIFTLNDKEKEELQLLINKIGLDTIDLNSEKILSIKEYSQYVPKSIYKVLIHFKRFSNRQGVVVFKNLPKDNELPKTPEDGKPSVDKKSFISETILFLFMSILGEVFGYEDEKNGQLVHDISPIKGQEKNIENSGSDVFFSYHVEDAIHPYKPDYLALYCLRSDHEKVAITETSSISEAIKKLNDSTLNILREPMYELHPPASFNSSHLSRKVSVIGGSQKQPNLLIHETLPKVSNGVQLNPGELIILDNNKAAHARSAFKPRYDGKDRWLQRMFSVNDLKGLEDYMKEDENIFIPLVDILKEKEK
ncbi:TauD/TfdA family dioxygenase [Staphylococcus aureus]|uniref:TauD/TfdA family dioxygenase n=1 Tax=Staphylococcus aureus TaxID=1280 RepID=UPI001CF52E22|nr:TauD/TfdA family dioxygenase [Staphylococcus aureus]MBZ8167561.1 hypothetical protein [Staphylococcus aureus]MBZ8170189.1 hypothetical protein [Staphylococcus aureus]